MNIREADTELLFRGTSLTVSRFFTVAFIPLVALYLATATWSTPTGADSFANIVTAHELADDGDVYLDQHRVVADETPRGVSTLTLAADGSAVSQYPPGAAILAVPLYSVWPGEPQATIGSIGTEEVRFPSPPIAPAAITAATVTALGVAMLGLSFRIAAPDRVALAAVYTLGLATAVWSVAADKLWLHSAGVLYLGAATWLSARFHFASGLAYGLAILTRPHTAFIAAGTGLGRSWHVRRWRPAIMIGVGAGLGLLALMAFNGQVFGSTSLSGGYGIDAGRVLADSPTRFIRNMSGALFDPMRGLFVYSPFLLGLVPGIRAAWTAAPAWARGSAVGGAAYFVLQMATNRYSGGSGFWGYRYPIELIVASAPLLLYAYTNWVSQRPIAKKVFIGLVLLSVQIQAIGALRYYGCEAALCV